MQLAYQYIKKEDDNHIKSRDSNLLTPSSASSAQYVNNTIEVNSSNQSDLESASNLQNTMKSEAIQNSVERGSTNSSPISVYSQDTGSSKFSGQSSDSLGSVEFKKPETNSTNKSKLFGKMAEKLTKMSTNSDHSLSSDSKISFGSSMESTESVPRSSLPIILHKNPGHSSSSEEGAEYEEHSLFKKKNALPGRESEESVISMMSGN